METLATPLQNPLFCLFSLSPPALVILQKQDHVNITCMRGSRKYPHSPLPPIHRCLFSLNPTPLEEISVKLCFIQCTFLSNFNFWLFRPPPPMSELLKITIFLLISLTGWLNLHVPNIQPKLRSQSLNCSPAKDDCL